MIQNFLTDGKFLECDKAKKNFFLIPKKLLYHILESFRLSENFWIIEIWLERTWKKKRTWKLELRPVGPAIISIIVKSEQLFSSLSLHIHGRL